MDLAIKPVESDEELRLANDLIAQEHAAESAMVRYWLENGGGHPGQEAEHTRIAVWKGEVAGALRINTETMRVGEARLRVGGLGWLTTAPRHRGKGIAALLMQDALAYLKLHGYHAALLFGNQEIFHRFGFVTTLADYTVLVETPEAARFQTPYKVRPAKPGDIASIQKIHAVNDSATDCSIVRTRAHLISRWHRLADWSVLTDPQGKVVAYFGARDDGDHLAVVEVGVSEPGVCGAVLATCAEAAGEHGIRRIRFHVPPPHPFARFLLQFRSVHEIHVLGDGSGMMTLVDIGETLESLIPEWESLLAQSVARDLRTEATLVVDGSAYRIRANRGAVDVAAMPGRNKASVGRGDLMHLITGYRHPGDILADRRTFVSAEARTLLFRLFPKREPYVWMFDRF